MTTCMYNNDIKFITKRMENDIYICIVAYMNKRWQH